MSGRSSSARGSLLSSLLLWELGRGELFVCSRCPLLGLLPRLPLPSHHLRRDESGVSSEVHSRVSQSSDRGTRKDHRARSRSASTRDRSRRSRSRSASHSWSRGREHRRRVLSWSLSSRERSRSLDRYLSRWDRSRRDRSHSSDRYCSRRQRSQSLAHRGGRLDCSQSLDPPCCSRDHEGAVTSRL